MIRWFFNLFRRSKSHISERWLIEHDIKEASEGWTGPRWRFPSEIAEQEKLDRKRRISLARSRIAEERESRSA